MKYIVLSFSILFALNTFSSEISTLTKVFDGTKAECKTSADVWDFRFQAHSIKSLKVEVSDDKVNLDLESVMLSCSKKDSSFAFSEKNVFSDFEYKIVSSFDENNNPIINTVTISTNAAELILFNKNDYTEVSSINIQPSNNVISKISHSIEVDKVLNTEELIKYNNGETIKKSLDLYLVRNISLDTIDYSDRFNQAYGLFRINLTISK